MTQIEKIEEVEDITRIEFTIGRTMIYTRNYKSDFYLEQN
jgi:hypothetical protein